MPRYKKIYETKAREYDVLVSREDHAGNLLPAIDSIRSLAGLEVAEFGAGTGRLTFLLAPYVKHVAAFDAYAAMVQVGNDKRVERGITNISLNVADNKALPLRDHEVDLAVAGWTFGHCTSWFPETWREEVAAAVQEMMRVTKHEGTAIILETLGTGQTTPKPPNAALAEYFTFSERDLGFSRVWVRTDYRFESLDEATHLTRTFFGRDYEYEHGESSGVILPECTGIWYRSVDDDR